MNWRRKKRKNVGGRWRRRRRRRRGRSGGGAATTVDKTFTARQWRLRGALLCRVFKRGETNADACHWVTCDDNGKGVSFLAPLYASNFELTRNNPRITIFRY